VYKPNSLTHLFYQSPPCADQFLNTGIGIVNLTISKPHNRSAVSSLYYQAMIWAQVTSCHSQNALERNSR